MKALWITLAALFAAYLIFIAGPVLVSFFSVFCKKRAPIELWEQKRAANCSYTPYLEDMKSAASRLREREVRRLTRKVGELELAADYYPGSSGRTLLLCHGYNARPLSNFSQIAEKYLDEGWNLLMPYARVHAPSRGGRASLGLFEAEDLLGWIDEVFASTDTKELVLWGVSMGSATIAYASDRIRDPRVKGMILDCGYSSPYAQYVHDSKERHLPWRLMMPLARLLANCVLHRDMTTSVRSSLQKTTLPALFLHGEEDRVVPIEEGRKNYESCAAKKYFLAVPDADHALSYPCILRAGDDTIDRFFDEILCGEPK